VTKRDQIAQARFDCPVCGARPGQPCTSLASGKYPPPPLHRPHIMRQREARKAGF
jgi:hypothetical protein